MEKIIVKRIKGRELSDTLRSMKVGEEILIKEKEFRSTSVSSACYRLKKKGFHSHVLQRRILTEAKL